MAHAEVVAEQYDRCDWHLANWATWMRAYRPKLQFPSRASVIGRSFSTTFDDMVDEVDQRCAVAVDTIIDDLPLAERLAVYHIHLHAVWRLRLLDSFYAKAKGHVAEGLTKRGIW